MSRLLLISLLTCALMICGVLLLSGLWVRIAFLHSLNDGSVPRRMWLANANEIACLSGVIQEIPKNIKGIKLVHLCNIVLNYVFFSFWVSVPSLVKVLLVRDWLLVC